MAKRVNKYRSFLLFFVSLFQHHHKLSGFADIEPQVIVIAPFAKKKKKCFKWKRYVFSLEIICWNHTCQYRDNFHFDKNYTEYLLLELKPLGFSIHEQQRYISVVFVGHFCNSSHFECFVLNSFIKWGSSEELDRLEEWLGDLNDFNYSCECHLH